MHIPSVAKQATLTAAQRKNCMLLGVLSENSTDEALVHEILAMVPS
jgi:hypothetical protein